MKKSMILMVLALSMLLAGKGFAQEKAYKDGSVWSVTMIKTSANMSDEYLKNLKTTWAAVHDEAKKQGLILSFKVLSGAASNPSDWDILLMTEYKNLASMEGNEDKWDAIYSKVVGSEDVMKQLNDKRVAMRTIFGDKLLREVVYK